MDGANKLLSLFLKFYSLFTFLNWGRKQKSCQDSRILFNIIEIRLRIITSVLEINEKCATIAFIFQVKNKLLGLKKNF